MTRSPVRLIILATALLTACTSSPTPTERAAEAIQAREPSLREQADALVKTDRAAAHVLYAQLCDQGDGEGCLRAARTLDLARAEARASFFSRACEHGETGGCLTLAFSYWRGDGVEVDLDRALALQRQTCEGGEEIACKHVDEWTGLLESTPRDELIERNRSQLAFERARSTSVSNAYQACEPELDSIVIEGWFSVGLHVTASGRVVDVQIREEKHQGSAVEVCFQRALADVQLPEGHEGDFVAVFTQ